MKEQMSVGYCRFCGRSRMVEAPEGNEANIIATRECDCDQAANERTRERIMEEFKQNMHVQFPMQTELYDAVYQCADLLSRRKIDGMTMRAGTMTLKISRMAGGIKCKKTVKSEETTEATG